MHDLPPPLGHFYRLCEPVIGSGLLKAWTLCPFQGNSFTSTRYWRVGLLRASRVSDSIPDTRR